MARGIAEMEHIVPDLPTIQQIQYHHWFHFAQSDNDINPLIKMVLLHNLCEAIHPFTDGNGRTRKVLNALYLTQVGRFFQLVLYLSQCINAFKSAYYRLVRNVTEQTD